MQAVLPHRRALEHRRRQEEEGEEIAQDPWCRPWSPSRRVWGPWWTGRRPWGPWGHCGRAWWSSPREGLECGRRHLKEFSSGWGTTRERFWSRGSQAAGQRRPQWTELKCFFAFKTKLLNSDLKLTEEKGSSDGDEGEEVDFQVRSCDPAPHQLSELLTVCQQRVDLGHVGFLDFGFWIFGCCWHGCRKWTQAIFYFGMRARKLNLGVIWNMPSSGSPRKLRQGVEINKDRNWKSRHSLQGQHIIW